MKRTLLSAVLLGAIVLACSSALLAKSNYWVQVTFLKGDVTARIGADQSRENLRLGMILHQGDKILVPEGAMVSMLMSDGSILVLRPGPEFVLEPQKKAKGPSLQKVAENLSATLLDNEGNNPMLKHLTGLRATETNLVVAPNRTKVRAGHVTLIWNARPGTTRYAITVMGPGETMFEAFSGECRLDLPAQKMAPSATYYWEVRDAEAKDTIVPLGSGSFSTVAKASEDKVGALEASIRAEIQSAADLDPSTPYFLLYQIYRQHGLSLDALLSLEKMISAAPQDASLQRWRSELCQEMELQNSDIPKLILY
jgi:hypothetical protein